MEELKDAKEIRQIEKELKELMIVEQHLAKAVTMLDEKTKTIRLSRIEEDKDVELCKEATKCELADSMNILRYKLNKILVRINYIVNEIEL